MRRYIGILGIIIAYVVFVIIRSQATGVVALF